MIALYRSVVAMRRAGTWRSAAALAPGHTSP